MNRFHLLKTAIVIALSVSLVLLMVPTGRAADETRLALGNLIEELVQRNPEIKAARERWEAAKAIVPQMQALPDPKLQLGYQRMPMVDPLQGGPDVRLRSGDSVSREAEAPRRSRIQRG